MTKLTYNILLIYKITVKTMWAAGSLLDTEAGIILVHPPLIHND